MRAFEMPPHAEMSLAQQLLLRALICRFWKEPYQQKLARWGTELHDRFMLPHFIEQDFRDVLEEAAPFGIPFRTPGSPPIGSFASPSSAASPIMPSRSSCVRPSNHGTFSAKSRRRAARHAMSTRRSNGLQVKVTNLTDARHVVACNGRKLPLHPTGVNGEFVAGVASRAWQPPSCLHPTIGINTPWSST